MSIFNKLRSFVGLSEDQEYDYEYEETGSREYTPPAEEPARPAPEPEDFSTRRRERPFRSEVGSNVIGMPGASNVVSQVVLMEPRSFEEMPAAIQALRERKSVVLNLTMMEPDQAQRAVDFVAGGTYAIDGHQERIGDSIFLFAPSCVQVTTMGGNLSEPPLPQVKIPSRPAMSSPAWSAEPSVNRFAQQ
ncbi:MAG: cell division protein SepF [Pseudanabaenaceae cyanobacterium SKYGB_i_bin29]|nr:cell division protein SepF [Pseudanabaenaceae cyanobacterium SKYG29]MDW8420664.1 cell division protein SepF [Pseudanabaenaceae cyanobacterium SKYGB_i_bin29]